MSKRQYLVVELRPSAALQRLQQQNIDLRREIEALKKTVSTLESRYGYEVMLNGELVDLCKLYNVPFRETLDFRRHPF